MSRARPAKASKSRAKSRIPATRYLIPAAVLILVAGVSFLLVRQLLPSGGGASSGGAFAQVGRVQAADYHSLTFSASDSSTLFFGHHNGILQSTDGGRSWQTAINRPNFDAMTLGASSDILWMAGHNVFYKSTDRGKNWSEVQTNLPGLDLHAFTVSPSDPNKLFAFAVGFGLFRSSDGGRSWEPLGTGAPPMPLALAIGGTTETLFIGTDQGLVMSQDGGQTFSSPLLVGDNPVVAVTATAHSNLIYAGTPRGLFRSQDGGTSWEWAGYNGDVTAVTMAANNPQRVALVDRQGKVFASS